MNQEKECGCDNICSKPTNSDQHCAATVDLCDPPILVSEKETTIAEAKKVDIREYEHEAYIPNEREGEKLNYDKLKGNMLEQEEEEKCEVGENEEGKLKEGKACGNKLKANTISIETQTENVEFEENYTQQNGNEIPASNQQEQGHSDSEDESERVTGLAHLINNMNNNIFLTEENLEALHTILFNQESLIDKVRTSDPMVNEKLEKLIKVRSEAVMSSIGESLKFYHQKVIDGELGHLEKFMKILKSSKKEMYLRRVDEENAGEKEGDIGQEEENIGLSLSDLGRLTSLNILNKGMMPGYDPVDKSITFRMNSRFVVSIKSIETSHVDKTSFFSKVPYTILQNNVYSYFSAFDLFRLRGVCKEWRELIRSVWHQIFKREMYEQIFAADLCQQIERSFKQLRFHTPFYHKLGILIKAFNQIIEWNELKAALNSMSLDNRVKKLFFSLMITLRGGDLNFDTEKLSDFGENHWEQIKDTAIDDIILDSNNILLPEFHFVSSEELVSIKKKFVDSFDISFQSIHELGDKNMNLICIFLKQIILFGLLKNSINLSQRYLLIMKDKLKAISNEWPTRKGFLEGAYKILLFRNVKINEGNVIICEENEDFFNFCSGEGNNEEEEEANKRSFLESLFSIEGEGDRDPTKPDFTIRKRGCETRIFLDEKTRSEILLNSLIRVGREAILKIAQVAKAELERLACAHGEEQIVEKKKKRRSRRRKGGNNKDYDSKPKYKTIYVPKEEPIPYIPGQKVDYRKYKVIYVPKKE